MFVAQTFTDQIGLGSLLVAIVVGGIGILLSVPAWRISRQAIDAKKDATDAKRMAGVMRELMAGDKSDEAIKEEPSVADVLAQIQTQLTPRNGMTATQTLESIADNVVTLHDMFLHHKEQSAQARLQLGLLPEEPFIQRRAAHPKP